MRENAVVDDDKRRWRGAWVGRWCSDNTYENPVSQTRRDTTIFTQYLRRQLVARAWPADFTGQKLVRFLAKVSPHNQNASSKEMRRSLQAILTGGKNFPYRLLHGRNQHVRKWSFTAAPSSGLRGACAHRRASRGFARRQREGIFSSQNTRYPLAPPTAAAALTLKLQTGPGP